MSTLEVDQYTGSHTAAALVAGDDWELRATLTDENGVALDLTDANVLWCLLDYSYIRKLDIADVTITIDDALTGQVSVKVTHDKTTTLAAGFYSDAWRIQTISTGLISTVLYGAINIMADPWAAQPQPYASVLPFRRTLARENDRRRELAKKG